MGNVRLLSFTSSVFIHVLVLYGPMPSRHTCLVNEVTNSNSVFAECLIESNCLYFSCWFVWSSSENNCPVRTMRFIANQTIRGPIGLQIVSLVLQHASADDVLWAPRRRINFLGWFNIRCLSRILQAFRFMMATVHTATKKDNVSVGVRETCCQSSELLPFMENVTTGVF